MVCIVNCKSNKSSISILRENSSTNGTGADWSMLEVGGGRMWEDEEEGEGRKRKKVGERKARRGK